MASIRGVRPAPSIALTSPPAWTRISAMSHDASALFFKNLGGGDTCFSKVCNCEKKKMNERRNK